MIGTYVSPSRTVVTPGTLRVALKDAFGAAGVPLDERALDVLVAFSAQETARWRSCWNYNLGNVKADDKWPGSYTCLTNVWEILNGVKRWFSPTGETAGKSGAPVGPRYTNPPGHPQTRFRAYASLAEGVDGFVAKMVGKYRPALDVLTAGGSSDAFVAALKRAYYFTGDLAGYQNSVRSFLREFSDEKEDVRAVQSALILLGYRLGVADGVFGPATRAAVIAFQRDRNLKPDGVVGPVTRAALAAARPGVSQ